MNITKRELAVMQVLWDAEEPLTVVEIVEREENGTVDAVQRVTKCLLKKNWIAIEGYTQVGNKISRKLKPLVSQESIEVPTITNSVNNLIRRNISTSHIVAALLPTDHTQSSWDELDKLEALIREKKKEIQSGNQGIRTKKSK